MVEQAIDPHDPAVRRRNLKLAAVVVGFFLFFLLTALVKFTFHGLPVDKTEHMKVKQRETAEAPTSAEGTTP